MPSVTREGDGREAEHIVEVMSTGKLLSRSAGIVAPTSVRCFLAEVDTVLLNGTVARTDRGEYPSGT